MGAALFRGLCDFCVRLAIAAGGRLIATAVAVLFAFHAFAAEHVDLSLKNDSNFGRMIVSFPDRNLLPTYKVTTDNGILVLTFDTQVDINVDKVASTLPNYVMIARADPEGYGLRLAMARSVHVNTMEAGPQLFIDFLPSSWTGPPPRLPDDVVAALAKRAELAAQAAARAEMLKVVGDKPARIAVTAARTPTFSRLSFNWNVPFDANFQRGDMGVSLTFNRLAPVDIADLKVNLPPFVDDITYESTDKGLVFHIFVESVADIRAYKDGDSYVVDVQGPPNMANLGPLDRALQSAVGAKPGSVPESARNSVSAPAGESSASPSAASHGDKTAPAAPADQAHAGKTDHAPATGEAAAPVAHDNAATSPSPDTQHANADVHVANADAHVANADAHAAENTATPPADAHPAVDAASADKASAQPHPPVEAAKAESATPAHADVPPPPPANSEQKVSALAATTQPAPPGTDGKGLNGLVQQSVDVAELPSDQNTRQLADNVIRVEAKRVGQAAHLVFPYKNGTGAALFTRGTDAWLVFDNMTTIDAASLQDALVGFARTIEPIPIDNGQAVRIEFSQAYLLSLTPDGASWVMTIGEQVADPTRPLSISRHVHLDGTKSLDVPFGPVSRIHQLRDEQSGEPLFVVTGKGQPRGLIKPQAFSEFDALASVHGLALVPKVDDLEISVDGELVSISRPGGLSVSMVAGEKKATLNDLPKALGSSLSRQDGYVDFSNMAAEDPVDFWDKRHKMMLDVAQAQGPTERVNRWYKFATFNVANSLGPEAKGVLDLIRTVAPEEESTDRMTILRSASELLSYRPDSTVTLLDAPKFKSSPDASVWRAMALSELGKHADASGEFLRGDQVVDSFPSLIHRRYVLDEIATSIETGDFNTARDRLAKIDPKSISTSDHARLDLLNALARDAAGRTTDAIALLSNIVREYTGPEAAEATYRLVQLQRREGTITLEQAIDRLEQLSVAWRGDELELKTLRLLGQYSVQNGDYRRAFEVMRVAEQINPNSNTSKLMNEEMQSAFADLYLDGKADSMPPVRALALYYDFRELTPNGRRGDAMVRKLANRLVDVDLLTQAEKLLSYQVENRLRGAARAQVAADLALVYLLDNRPDKALYTLAKTRQAQLPVGIERQRRMVEAKAMANSGNVDGALELISPLSGGEIERLRGDILWAANRYEQAGAQFERLLGGRWNGGMPLSPDEQLEVLKAGIAYTLINDRLSVDRLRSKYVAKMAATSNGSAFEAVTGPIVAGDSNNFDSVVKSVAAADTMASFLADYRKRYLDIGATPKPEVINPMVDAPPPPPSADAGTSTPKTG